MVAQGKNVCVIGSKQDKIVLSLFRNKAVTGSIWYLHHIYSENAIENCG